MRRLSLRARLLLGVVVLAAVGLVVADVATYALLRSFLLDRVDSSLEAGHPFVERAAFDGESGPLPRGGPGPPAQGIDWYQVRTLGGQPLRSSFLVQGSAPKLLSEYRFRLTRPSATATGRRTSRWWRAREVGATGSARRSSRRSPAACS